MLFRYIKRGETDPQTIQKLAADTGLSSFTAQLLAQRGITDPVAAREFLAPEGGALHDPFAMLGMAQAVERIRRAVALQEQILIYGDYDVDGVMGTSVLCSYLRSIGADPRFYVPSRHTEGYGLNRAALERLCPGVQLLISVDCGISNAEEVAFARALGLDVIVTDHHQCPETLPPANVVINPHQPGETYPFADLCGAGVAGKLVQALGGEEALNAHMDMVALATVADLVPLTGENRTFVKRGLKQLKTPRPGMAALLKEADLKSEELNAGRLAFAIAPRINAGGRMDLSGKSIELMLTCDPLQAEEIAAELSADNARRQQEEQEILAEAEVMLSGHYDFSARRCIVLYSPRWNTGIIGIVASRLAERYTRPVLLFGNGEGACYGSGRSVPGVNLYHCLQAVSRFFIRYGGHEQAGGCAATAENIPLLAEALDAYLKETYEDAYFYPYKYYDAELSPEVLNLGLCAELTQLEPFGMGNPKPAALFSHQRGGEVRQLSGGKHLKFRLSQTQVQCIAFSQGALHSAVEDSAFDLVGLPQADYYYPRSPRLQILTEHIRPYTQTATPTEAQWVSCLLSQAAMPEAERPPALCVLSEGQWAQTLTAALAESPWGTALLCLSPGELPTGVSLPENLYTSQGSICTAQPGENIRMLAPVVQELTLHRYNRLFLYGALSVETAAYLSTVLNEGGRCYIIKGNILPADLALSVGDLSREAMARRYGMLKRRELPPTAEKDGLPADLRAALQVFQELGFLAPAEAPLYYTLCRTEGKKELTLSRTYRRLLQAQAALQEQNRL